MVLNKGRTELGSRMDRNVHSVSRMRYCQCETGSGMFPGGLTKGRAHPSSEVGSKLWAQDSRRVA